MIIRETECFTRTYNGKTFVFERPRDSNALLEEIGEEEFMVDEFLPYWAELWPSSDTAVDFLLSRFAEKPQSILEIGAGLGMVSVILASQGHHLTASDYSEESCGYIRKNSERNNLSVSAVCADWRNPSFSVGVFSSVVGIDILYEERWCMPVAQCIAEVLHPDGEAFIFDPHRPFRHCFVQSIEETARIELAETLSFTSPQGIQVDCYRIVRGE